VGWIGQRSNCWTGAHGEKPELNRRLKLGTVLVREYRGDRHTVTVVPDGFVWRDTTYGSLSMIARAITGTAWNGPRFFGLRVAAARANEKEGSGSVARPIHIDQARASGRPDKKDCARRG
jgi:hypothetical protein